MTTALPPSSFSDASSVGPPSEKQHRSKQLEKSYRNYASSEEAERKWFAGLLWKAVPEARSENELSEIMAEILTTEKRSIHSKTVRNWLRCENSPHFRYFMKVLAMAGAESLFQIIDGTVE